MASPLRPLANPPNPWATTDVEYLEGEAPLAELQVYEDHTKGILAHNDSPDVGFSWSVNPYRGCFHACAYCLSGDTRILMADGTTKPLRDVRVGDSICGTTADGKYLRVVKTRVLAHWQTVKAAHRLTLGDGRTIVGSGDHRFLTRRGWKYMSEAAGHRADYLTGSDVLVGERSLGAGDPDTGLRVARVEALGREMPMFDITTGTGDFIADGVVAHNCYARPSHEYLSFGAGTDFERKIVVKPDAPQLLREAFDEPKWKGELVVFSGVTDCYQPLEASYRLTRGCLEVCAEYRQPVGIISKAPLVERDIDVFQELTHSARFSIAVSCPFWDEGKARAIEPFVTTPARRIRTIERLAKAGIDVGVMVAPIIPGLNDEDMGEVLRAAAHAGATHAGMVLLRLPGPVADVFEQRLRATLPLRADRVLRRIRETRGGKLYDSRFAVRGRGEGPYAESIQALFEQTAQRFGLSTHRRDRMGRGGAEEPPETTFRRPRGQLGLF